MRSVILLASVLLAAPAQAGNAEVTMLAGTLPCAEFFTRLYGETSPEGAAAYYYLVGFANARNIVATDDMDSFLVRSEMVCREHGGSAADVLHTASALF